VPIFGSPNPLEPSGPVQGLEKNFAGVGLQSFKAKSFVAEGHRCTGRYVGVVSYWEPNELMQK
jgi:hypothetical protein